MKEEVREVVEELINTFRIRVIEQPSGFSEIAGYIYFLGILDAQFWDLNGMVTRERETNWDKLSE